MGCGMWWCSPIYLGRPEMSPRETVKVVKAFWSQVGISQNLSVSNRYNLCWVQSSIFSSTWNSWSSNICITEETSPEHQKSNTGVEICFRASFTFFPSWFGGSVVAYSFGPLLKIQVLLEKFHRILLFPLNKNKYIWKHHMQWSASLQKCMPAVAPLKIVQVFPTEFWANNRSLY